MRLKQEYEKAADLLEKVIDIKKKHLKTNDHRDLAILYNDLAITYEGLELFEDSADAIKETIRINEALRLEKTSE